MVAFAVAARRLLFSISHGHGGALEPPTYAHDMNLGRAVIGRICVPRSAGRSFRNYKAVYYIIGLAFDGRV